MRKRSYYEGSKSEYSPVRQNSKQNILQNDESYILKSKLLETHNKLLNQLQINKEKQSDILHLKKENNQLKRELSQIYENKKYEYDLGLGFESVTQINSKGRMKNQLKSIAENYTELVQIYKKNQQEKHLKEKQFEKLRKQNQELNTRILELGFEKQKLIKSVDDLRNQYSQIKIKSIELETQLKQQKELTKNLSKELKLLQGKIFKMILKHETIEDENYQLKATMNQNSKNQTKKFKTKQKNRQLTQNSTISNQVLASSIKNIHNNIKQRNDKYLNNQIEQQLIKTKKSINLKNHSSKSRKKREKIEEAEEQQIFLPQNKISKKYLHNSINDNFNRY